MKISKAPRPLLEQKYRDLKQEVEGLRHRLEILQGNDEPLNDLGLTTQQFRIAYYLAMKAPRLATAEQIMEARRPIHDYAVEERDIKNAHVQIHHVRTKLAKHDIVVENRWGRGYFMSQYHGQKFLFMVSQPEDLWETFPAYYLPISKKETA